VGRFFLYTDSGFLTFLDRFFILNPVSNNFYFGIEFFCVIKGFIYMFIPIVIEVLFPFRVACLSFQFYSTLDS
jgi:hypothetical protein